jgi:hypothetical protein
MGDYTPEHWVRCAEEAREKAREMNDLELKREMELIAQAYERLAIHAVRQQKRDPDG